MAAAERRRCAVYTRKSSEEGLEQDFNSLDAQREACAAYIQSQAGEGWRPVRARYDDGGFSGGTLDRPGLARLLADIEAGRVDTVVVYKVDRLTRSLADFAKIVEVFDAHGVSFVSVTQQFNTTTSMGRLTLNMLLSFAQFEREVTGERIRDKIAASKRKGLWMGGYVPLGYESEGRTLAVNEVEAQAVRTVFRLYLELGTVRKVKVAADRLGLRTKVRPGKEGRMGGGRPFSRGHLYHLLSNPLYVGRVAHRGEQHEGQHPAIIDLETWEAVQAQLASQAPPASTAKARSSHRSPLRGKLFDEHGERLTPKHAVKNGKRYRYYVSRKLAAGTADATAGKTWRLPAREIERLVSEAVQGLLGDAAKLTRLARDTGLGESKVPVLLTHVGRRDGDPLDLVRRVGLTAAETEIVLDLSQLAGQELVVTHTVPIALRRRGVESKLVLEDGGREHDREPDPTLIKALARAQRWLGEMLGEDPKSLSKIASAEGLSAAYVSYGLPLAFLAPDIVERILVDRQPDTLTMKLLTRTADLPLDWAEQRALLGLDRP